MKGLPKVRDGKLASGPSLVSGILCDLSQGWCLFVSTYVLRAGAATVDAASLRRHSASVGIRAQAEVAEFHRDDLGEVPLLWEPSFLLK